jgi:hypothetical protein
MNSMSHSDAMHQTDAIHTAARSPLPTSTLDCFAQIAPHYYDLSQFPECEAKHDLEAVYRRMLKSANGS